MRPSKTLICLLSLCIIALGASDASAFAATPSFTITAKNTTMPSTGLGLIAFTLTAVDGYQGGVEVGCTPPTHPSGTNIPACTAPEPYGAPVPFYVQLTPEMPVVNQSVYLYALPASIANGEDARSNHSGPEGSIRWAMAGVLVLGLGFGGRKGQWAAHLLLACALLVGLTAMTACGGNIPHYPTLTPGSYTYTVWAIGTTPDFSAKTTVTVTVPPGIVVE